MKYGIITKIFLVFVALTLHISEACRCVHVNQCSNVVINLRARNVCGSIWFICCEEEDMISDSEPGPNIPWDKKCGVSHPNGIEGYRIINADNYSQYGEFPWVVAVLKKDVGAQQFEYFRGGSLIHPSVVLTASFVLEGLPERDLIIRAGEYDRHNTNEPYPHQDRRVSAIVKHESSNRLELANNIALLFLVAPLDLAINVGTVLLPQQNNVVEIGTCIATGWGVTELVQSRIYAEILKRISLPIVEFERCEQLLRRAMNKKKFQLKPSDLCAGGRANEDTCFGDGGSPLVCPIEGNEHVFYQVGLVSWGVGCGHANVPAVYTNIASYRNWIDEKIKDRGFEAIDCDVVDPEPRGFKRN